MASRGKPPPGSDDTLPGDTSGTSEFEQAAPTAYDPELAKRVSAAAAESEEVAIDFDEQSTPTRESKDVTKALAAREARLTAELETIRSVPSKQFERELPTRLDKPRPDQIPLPELKVDETLPPAPARPPMSTPTPTSRPAPPTRRSYLWAGLLGIGIGGAGVAVAGWLMTSRAAAPPPQVAPAPPPAPVEPAPVEPTPPAPPVEPAPAPAAAASDPPAPTPPRTAEKSRSKRKPSRKTRRPKTELAPF